MSERTLLKMSAEPLGPMGNWYSRFPCHERGRGSVIRLRYDQTTGERRCPRCKTPYSVTLAYDAETGEFSAVFEVIGLPR